MSYRNEHGVRTRIINNVIELWLGEPDDPESCLLCVFHEDYLNSVLHQLHNIHKVKKENRHSCIKYNLRGV